MQWHAINSCTLKFKLGTLQLFAKAYIPALPSRMPFPYCFCSSVGSKTVNICQCSSSTALPESPAPTAPSTMKVHFGLQLRVKNQWNICLKTIPPPCLTADLPTACFFLTQNIRLLYNCTEQTLSQVLLPGLTLGFQPAAHCPFKCCRITFSN